MRDQEPSTTTMETRSSTVRQAANNEPLVGLTVPRGAFEEV
jgi:hypothetical protein